MKYTGRINILKKLAEIADELDIKGLRKEADAVTKVMFRFSQSTQSFNFRKSESDFSNKLNKMREMNQVVPEELKQARDSYITNAQRLNPNEHEEPLGQHWDAFTNALKQHPNLHNASFEDYSSWRTKNPNDIIEQAVIEHKGPNQLQKEFQDSGELDFETFKQRRLEEKAKDMHKAISDVHAMEKEFGYVSEEKNPFLALNNVRNQWSQDVAHHHKQSIPFSGKENPRVTLFTGFPGAGKSRFIEPNISDVDNPARETNYGILVDPDEYQRDLPGYLGGAGSQNTLVYALSKVKPEILKDALEKGNDVVIPLVGGSVETLLGEIVNHVIKNLNVDVITVPTDINLSHQRSINRAKQGGRLIAPYTSGDPMKAFEEAQQIIKNPNYELPDLFTKKLLTKLGYTTAQIKKLPAEEKSKIHDKYAALVMFDVGK
jgi:hypothetical protein